MNQAMIRGAMGGAALGGSVGGTLAWLVGVLMLGLEPLVFLAGGVYAGTVYGGIVGALLGARFQREVAPAVASTPRPAFGLAMAIIRSGRR